MVRLCNLLAVLAALAGPSVASAQQLGGMAQAFDGDTLDFTGTHIRIAGIDAPELPQNCTRGDVTWACGEEARAQLASLIDGREVSCSIVDSASEVPLAICTADGIDLADSLIRFGYAVAVQSIHVDLAEAEGVAKRYTLGIWGGTFTSPAEFRAANPPPKPAPSPRRAVTIPRQASPAIYRDRLGLCAIKGNRSYRGDWIYFLPGQNYYEQTRPEDRFCTEADALNAGYRPSRAG